MREVYHPQTSDLSLPMVLYALSDPIRLKIVRLIAANGEQACGDFGLPLPKPTLSHHYKVLREAGIIRIRQEGTQRLNSLRRTCLDSRFPGLLDAVLNTPAPEPAPPRGPLAAGVLTR